VYESYYQKELPSVIFDYEEVQETLFPVKEIATDQLSAKKVERSILHSISNEALQLVSLCYLSKMNDRETTILRFLRLGYKIGPSVTNMLANDVVRTITKSAQNVRRESHYYKEFLRFSEYNGALVSIIEPKNFVLPMISAHFCNRFSSEQFLIYDKSHKCALVYQNGKNGFVSLKHLELPEMSAKEAQYRELWKQFYNTIAIEGRINPKLRMNNMPKRYWSHMTEFMD
jgi:probable DNA metabolism protein